MYTFTTFSTNLYVNSIVDEGSFLAFANKTIAIWSLISHFGYIIFYMTLRILDTFQIFWDPGTNNRFGWSGSDVLLKAEQAWLVIHVGKQSIFLQIDFLWCHNHDPRVQKMCRLPQIHIKGSEIFLTWQLPGMWWPL